MKKVVGLILVAIFLINLFLISGVSAQVLDDLQDKVDKIEDVRDKVPTSQDEAKEVTSSYLKQEWTKILEKNQFGKIILAIGNVLNSLDPLFLLILGVEYSLSWYFTFAFLIWLAFFIFFFQLGRGIFPEKKIIVIPLAFIITSLIGISGAIIEIIDLSSNIITDTTAIAIAFIISLIILALIIKFTWQIAIFLRKTKEKWEKVKLKGDKKLIEATAEGTREVLK